MTIKKVTVLGTGNFGARIAYHIAFNKIDVTVYDQDYGLLEEARTKFREFGSYYQKYFGATTKNIEAAQANIAYSMDITEAAGNAHLIIEAVAEDLKIKKTIYSILKETAPKNAIFATTSQGLNLEQLAKSSGHPDKFVYLHFTGTRDHRDTIDIVGLPTTRKEILLIVADFSESIGMLPTIKTPEGQN